MSKLDRIRNKALKSLVPREETKRLFNGLDTDADEYKAVRLLQPHGEEWFATRDRNTMERWDIEGYYEGKWTRIEIKSRGSYTKVYDTWLIDSYKVDYMLDTFPDDNNFFMNVCDGEFQLYDMKDIRKYGEFRANVRTNGLGGKVEYHDYYYLDKDTSILDLK